MFAIATLQRSLRPAIMLGLTGTVCYLAVLGLPEARAAVLSAFTLLVGALWGERSALKIPGRKDQP